MRSFRTLWPDINALSMHQVKSRRAWENALSRVESRRATASTTHNIIKFSKAIILPRNTDIFTVSDMHG